VHPHWGIRVHLLVSMLLLLILYSRLLHHWQPLKVITVSTSTVSGAGVRGWAHGATSSCHCCCPQT